MFEQREVLHVARADLDDVGPLGDQLERLVVDGFGDDAESKAIADFGHDLECVYAESLKGVGRRAWLVGSAAEELCAGGRNLLGDGEGLFTAFDGAWTTDDGEVASADRGIGSREADDRVFFFNVATCKLVSLGNADDFGDAGKLFNIAAIYFALVAGDSDGGALRAGHRVGAVAQSFNVRADGLDLLRSGLRLHHN